MSRKAPAEIDVIEALADHEARVASVEARLKDSDRLAKVAADEKEQTRLLLLRQEEAREELRTEVARLAEFPLDERRHATLLACEKNLFAQLGSEDEIIAAAYHEGGASEYQEALFSEPMSVWQFARICAVHGTSKEEAWLRHKRAMIILRDAAKIARKATLQEKERNAAQAIFHDESWKAFASTIDEKIHPLDRNGVTAATLVDPVSAICWFNQTPIRASLLPSFCLPSYAPPPTAERIDEPEAVQGVRPREDAIVDALHGLYPAGRPHLLGAEMARAAAAVIGRPVYAKDTVFKRALRRLGWVKGRTTAK